MKKKNLTNKINKGFTLIEVVVTVAIIAIFSGVLVTLTTVGSNFFRGVSGNTKAQSNVQDIFDSMDGLMCDANDSVYYAYGSGSEIGKAIVNDIDDSNTRSKTFIIGNEYENVDGTSRYIFDVLDWDGSEGKIYYSQRQYRKASSEDETNNSESNPTQPEGELSSMSDENDTEDVPGLTDSSAAEDSEVIIQRSVFAEGIKNFTADVSRVESEQIVRIRLTSEENGKEVETFHTVHFRNYVRVRRPDDAFSEAEATDVGIKITQSSIPVDPLNPGESWIFTYERTGNGSLDVNTVKWQITDGAENGSFPTEDPSLGKLTINTNPVSSSVTVVVTAQTLDGQQTIVSKPVTVQINAKEITSIIPSSDTVLAGAGSSIDLNTAVKWHIEYSDGSIGQDSLSVKWSFDNVQYEYASIADNGNLIVDSDAGQESTGVLNVKAECSTGMNLSGQITVKIARIDIDLPEKDKQYFVGDERPAITYQYREGGQIVENQAVDLYTITKPETADFYQNSDKQFFEKTDEGDWEVKVEVNLNSKNGYGTISDTSKFNVKRGMYATFKKTNDSNNRLFGEFSNTDIVSFQREPYDPQKSNVYKDSTQYKIISVDSANREESDKEIWCPVYGRIDNNIFYWCSEADKVYFQDFSCFTNASSLQTVNLEDTDTSLVKDMGCAFQSCTSLKNIDISNLNTENVTDMNRMFDKCNNLSSITGLENLNTKKVTNMQYMFAVCKNLTTITLGENFDTGNVTNKNMEGMFTQCENLSQVNTDKLNTHNVTSLFRMFDGCKALSNINLSSFDTSNVNSMQQMFKDCTSLRDIDLSNLNTSKVTTMQQMFYNCYSLGQIDFTNFDTSSVSNMQEMFYQCSNLKDVTGLGDKPISNVTTMKNMFLNCSKLNSITFGSEFQNNKVSNIGQIFKNCSNLTSVDLTNFNTSNVTDMNRMFDCCSNLTSVTGLGRYSTSTVTNMSNMFASCKNLESITFEENFNTQAVTNMDRMFNQCGNLTTIWVPDKPACFGNAGYSNVKSGQMFGNCKNLKGSITWDSKKTDGKYANISEGYFTNLAQKPVS